jgi:hypothetical protein
MTRAAGLAILVVACYSGPQQQAPPPASYPQEAWASQNDGQFYCTALESQAARGSQCFPSPERCEDERRRAGADGLAAAPCRPQSPVACFQLAGDPDPGMEMCAATAEDCDLLRLIDQDKHGRTGAACEWRHGPGLPAR